MDTLPRLFLARFLLLCLGAILLPQSVAAQATLSVVPTSVSVQTSVGTNAPSQTVQVRKTGGGALRWTVEPPAAAWLTVSPTSGTNNVTLTLTFQTSALAAQTQPYTTSFRVVSGTQSVTVNVAVTIVGSTPPPTLTITCPANISVASPDGLPVVVTYTVTTSGGNPPVTLTVNPPSGSSFAVNTTTTVQANAQSQDGQTESCSFTVTVTSSSSGDWTFCASENQFCAFSGTKQVRYGANNTFFVQTLTDGTPCTNAVFGDPIFGTAKHCDVSSPPPTLTITCPANISVASPDGLPVVVTYTVTTSGGTPPVTLTVNPPSGSSFAVNTTTTVQANAQSQDGQTKSCSFTVTVTSSSSGDWTFCASENQFCAFSGTKQVRYGANNTFFVQTLTDGTPCTNAVFGDPIFGTAKHCDVNSTAPPPPPVSGVGPQAAITCPSGAADILPGQSIQLIINANVAGTTFCLRAGVHQLTSSIRPKTGNTFVGEYLVVNGEPRGAVLDGTGWTTTDGTQAAFRVYDDPDNPNDPNNPIDNVTIRNLVIRNMPQWGIHAHYGTAHHWTIDHNEIGPNKWGVLFGPDFTIRNNYIHHNVGNSSSPNPGERGGGYAGVHSDNTIVDSNEIAYNGREQKVGLSANVTFRNNFVHHNVGDGIWYDSNANAGALIDGNRVEDNGRNGIFFEASIGATISNNTVRRHTWDAVFISMSQNAQIYNNTLEANVGGIDYFLNCFTLSATDDVKNNAAYDNTVVVATQGFTYGSAFTSTGCTSTQLVPYLNGSKNLTFSRNAYRVPSLSFTQYFFWGGLKDWNQWQALGQDVGGSISQ